MPLEGLVQQVVGLIEVSQLGADPGSEREPLRGHSGIFDLFRLDLVNPLQLLDQVCSAGQLVVTVVQGGSQICAVAAIGV